MIVILIQIHYSSLNVFEIDFHFHFVDSIKESNSSVNEEKSDLQTKRSPSVDDQDQNDDVEPIKKRKLMMLDSDEE